MRLNPAAAQDSHQHTWIYWIDLHLWTWTQTNRGAESWSRGYRSSLHTFQTHSQGISPREPGRDEGGGSSLTPGIWSSLGRTRSLLSVKAPQQARHSPTTSLMRAELVNWAWNFWTSPQHHWSMLFCPERETRACWSGALDSSQQVNTATWGRGVFTCDRPAFFLRLTFTKQVVVFSSLLLFLFFLQCPNVWLCFQGCISLFLFIPRLCLWLDECMFDTGSGIWMPRGCRTSTVGQSVSRMCTLTQSSARSEVGGWRMVNHCKRTTERKCVCGGMAFTGSNRKLAAAFRWQKYN